MEDFVNQVEEERMSAFSMDVTEADFEQKVIGASMNVPVVVDLWAEWCGPCRMLKPVLEKLADEYQGRFLLAKVDSDQNQDIARQFAVRGIPTVIGIVNGREVARFTGAQPESSVREFLDKLMPSPAEDMVREAAAALSAGDVTTALQHLQQALVVDPSHLEARLATSEILLGSDRWQEARDILSALPAEKQLDGRVAALLARIDLALKTIGLPDISVLEQRVQTTPDDLEARLQLAHMLTAREAYEEALDQLLAIVRQDRKFREDIGRKTMLEVFQLLGGQGELVARYRRLLAQALN